MRVLSALVSLFLLCQGQRVEIRCNFTIEDFSGNYRCDAGEFVITPNTTQTIVIVGDHAPNRTNLDVVDVFASNQPLPFIITEFFTTFPNLQGLAIAGGLLRIQTDAFQSAQNLLSLTITNSPIRALPANVTAGASRLQSFAIVMCDELEKIDQNALHGLNNLEVIRIIGTSIRFLPENVFSTLTNLTTLFVTDNQIQTLPNRLFHNNLRIENIFFGNNPINAVGSNLVDNFVNLTNLTSFIFTGNNCGNSAHHPSNINEINSALQQCYRNYEQRRQFSLDLQGSLVIRDENGNVIFDAHV